MKLEQYIAKLSANQKIHAENIANAHTPGYKTLAVASAASGHNFRLALSKTHGSHRSPASRKSSGGRKILEKEAIDEKPNGNNVDVTRQVLLMQKNNMEYREAVGVYEKYLKAFSIVSGK